MMRLLRKMLVHRPIRYLRRLSVITCLPVRWVYVVRASLRNGKFRLAKLSQYGGRQPAWTRPVSREPRHPPPTLHPGLYANHLAGDQESIAFPSAIFCLSPSLSKKKIAEIHSTLH